MTQIISLVKTNKTGCSTPALDLKALIFDVDGTLYEQGPVRRAVLNQILRSYLTSPMQGALTLRRLYAYRKAQESLRKTPPESGELAGAQLLLAGRRAGTSTELITECVSRWMEQAPLPFIANSIRKGIFNLLREARKRGLRLAVFSDYPAQQKLEAMHMAGFFEVVMSAQDPEIQRFKPDPTGLRVVLQRLGVQNDEVVYIGNRADVDALAASRANIRHFMLRAGQDVSSILDLLIQEIRSTQTPEVLRDSTFLGT